MDSQSILQHPSQLMQLVQQYYSAPLNQELLRPVSSVTVIPVNSDNIPHAIEAVDGNLGGNISLSDDITSVPITSITEIQDGNETIITPPNDESPSASQASELVAQEASYGVSNEWRNENGAEETFQNEELNTEMLKEEPFPDDSTSPSGHVPYNSTIENPLYSPNSQINCYRGQTNSNGSSDVETHQATPAMAEAAGSPDDVEFVNSRDDYRWQFPSNICRVCAKSTDQIENLFPENVDTLRLVEMIHNHLPILVTPEDLLPVSVCHVCISHLQVAEKLVETCIEADATLRALLSDVSSDPSNDTLSQSSSPTHISSAKENHFSDTENSSPAIGSLPEQNAVTEEAIEMTVGSVKDVAPNVKVKMVQEKLPLSELLSQDDVSAIKEMKAEGLKVTLVRLPTLSNLSERAKHNRVLQILQTLKTDSPKKKKRKMKTVVVAGPSVSSVTSAAAAAVTVSTAPFTSTSQQDGGSESFMTDDESTFLRPTSPTSTEELPVDTVIKSKYPYSDPAKILKGINPLCLKSNNENSALIKLKSNQDSGEIFAAPAASPNVYVYVRSEDSRDGFSGDDGSQTEYEVEKLRIRERFLALKASKSARKQATFMRRLAQRKEIRLIQKIKRELTCVECKFTASSKEEMDQHKLDHLKCKFCGKLLKSKVQLAEHERVHTKEKPFVCEQCGWKFRTKQQMMQHAQRHNPERPYQCEICSRRFSVKTTYSAHVLRHNTESPYLCETCGKSFKIQAALRLHKFTHRTFSCPVCNKILSYRAYQMHKKSHSGEANFPCSVCNKKFLSNQRLKIHALIHEAKYPYSCGVCHRSFKRMTHLQAHRSRHAEEHLLGIAFYCCAVCEEQFDAAGKLSRHVQTHAPEDLQRLNAFRCTTCHKCFSIEEELRSHESRHSGREVFSCSICNQSFDQRKDFEEHSSSHVEEKPFACDVCGKRFRALLNLNNHKQIHVPSKPHSCPFCEKTFKTINGLNQHKMVHSDIRKHTCALCNMSFKRRDAMKNHQRTHFAERPYACSICGRSFKVKSDCSTHLKRHRESGMEGTVVESCYNCPVCSQTFTLKVDLSNHIQSVHSMDVAVLDDELEEEAVLSQEVTIFS